MKVFEVGFIAPNENLINDVLWSTRKYLVKNFDNALEKARKEISYAAKKKVKLEIDYIKSILRLD